MTNDEMNGGGNEEKEYDDSCLFNNHLLIVDCWHGASKCVDEWVDPAFIEGGASERPRTAAEASDDARFMLSLARLENSFRFHRLIEKGEIILVDEGELQKLKERQSAGKMTGTNTSYLSERGWEQDLEWMAIIRSQILEMPINSYRLKAILKCLRGVTRSSLLCDLK